MNYSWKSAALFWGVATIVIAISWYWVGQKATKAISISIDNKEQQAELEATLSQMKATQEIEQRRILRVVSDLEDRGATIPQELEDELGKMAGVVNQNQATIERLASMESVRTAEDSQRRAAFEEMRLLKQSLQNSLDQVREQITNRDKLITALRENESGRRIAASETHLDRFEALTLVLSPTTENVEVWDVTYTNLFDFVDASDRPPESFTVTESLDADILELKQDLKGAAQALAEDLLLLNTLVKETAEKIATAESLASHIESRLLKRANERTDAIADAAEQARSDGIAVLRKKAIEIRNAKDRLEAESIAREIAELDADATQVASERNQIIQEARQKRERKQLELDYSRDEPEIRSLLHPFVTAGIYQPSLYGFEGRYRPESMSLSAIGTVGALEQTDAGLNELYRVGGSDFTAMRGLGTFPSQKSKTLHTSSPDRKRVERAQELILKYGALLVEKGMLLK